MGHAGLELGDVTVCRVNELRESTKVGGAKSDALEGKTDAVGEVLVELLKRSPEWNLRLADSIRRRLDETVGGDEV